MRARVKKNVYHISGIQDVRGFLTPGCEYFVLGVDNEYLRVVNDRGEPILYPKRYFDVSDCLLPPGWRFDEVSDGAYCLQPSTTSAAGFYEDYFCSNGDEIAERKAHATVREAMELALATGQEADQAVLRRDLERLAKGQSEVPSVTTYS